MGHTASAFSCRVGRIKAEQGFLLFDPGREEAVLERPATASEGPIMEASLLAVYREMFPASKPGSTHEYRVNVTDPGAFVARSFRALLQQSSIEDDHGLFVGDGRGHC